MSWCVYLVRCADRSLYCGVSTDVQRRVVEHNTDPKGAKYTKARRPVTLVYEECCADRAAASSREAAIKKLTKAQKEDLIKTK